MLDPKLLRTNLDEVARQLGRRGYRLDTQALAALEEKRKKVQVIAQQFPQQGPTAYRFAFRPPPLRNVELTAPYMHDGAYPSLEAVVRHYNDVPTALRTYDVSQVEPALRGMHHGDEATITDVLSTLEWQFRGPLNLSDGERSDLVAFLKSLTDPAARDLSGLTPASVPSGLPVRE